MFLPNFWNLEKRSKNSIFTLIIIRTPNTPKMKKILLSGLLMAFCIISTQAQENKTIKSVSTVKRVVKKEGNKIIVKEVENVSKENGAVVVEGNEKENQVFSEKVAQEKKKNVLVDSITEDEKNKAIIAARKKQREEALAKSIAEEKARNEALRKEMAQREKERLQAMQKNKKRLQKRGKKMAKLKKNRKN